MSKFTSRKFLTAVAGLIAGIVIIFGVDENVVTTVSGAVVSVAGIVTYIVTEGRIDAASSCGTEVSEKDVIGK